MTPTSTTELVQRAGKGDESAWREIVDRFTRLVWHAIRGVGVRGELAADVHQATWLSLAENLGKIRDPEALGSWLATTARRECIRAGTRADRESPILDRDGLGPVTDPAGEAQLDAHLLEGERDSALWQAFSALGSSCQQMLRLLLVDPPFSYDEISVILDMPKGSIGPTRARCLERLRSDPRVAGLEELT